MRSTLAASMPPSTRNGMGAIGKTPLRPNKNNEFAVLKPEQDAVNHLETAQSCCEHGNFDRSNNHLSRCNWAPSCAARWRKPRSPPPITPLGFAAWFRHEED